jgi:hypothetical protein
MTTYIFNEAGSIPGIPGTFSNCRVDVNDGGLMVWPLRSGFTPTITTVKGTTSFSVEAVKPEDKSAEEAPPASENTPAEPPVVPPAATGESAPPAFVQEQAQPATTPYFSIGG